MQLHDNEFALATTSTSKPPWLALPRSACVAAFGSRFRRTLPGDSQAPSQAAQPTLPLCSTFAKTSNSPLHAATCLLLAKRSSFLMRTIYFQVLLLLLSLFLVFSRSSCSDGLAGVCFRVSCQLAKASFSAASTRCSKSDGLVRRRLHQLQPVDRGFDLRLLLEIADQNISNAKNLAYQPTVLFSSQMFGAGKTSLGICALALLQEDLARRADTQRVVPPLLASGWSLQKIQRFANARLLHIDLELNIPRESPLLERALYAALYRAAVGHANISTSAALQIVAAMADTAEFVDLLKAKTGADLLYIFIDEIRAIEALAAQSPDQFVDLRPPNDPYRTLLSLLAKLLRSGSVFVYIAGRSDLWSRALEWSRTSPCRLELLPLGPLSAEDIEETIRRTPWPRGAQAPVSTGLLERCKLPDEQIRAFAQRVHHWTAGVPRQVQHVLMYALTWPLDLSSPAAIETALRGPIGSAIILVPSVFSFPDLGSNWARAAYNALLAFHLHNIPFRFDLQLGDRVLFEWAGLLGFHVRRRPDRSTSRGDFELVVPPYMVQYLRSWSTLRAHPNLSVTAQLLREVVLLAPRQSCKSTLDLSPAFKDLVAHVLYWRLAVSSGHTLARDAVLGRSSLLQEVFPGFEGPLRIGATPQGMPDFYAHSTRPTAHYGFGFDQWRGFSINLPEGVVCGTGLRTPLGPSTVFKVRGAHALFHVKPWQGYELDTTSAIREAIIYSLLPFSDQLHSCDKQQRAVLFFLLTQYTEELETLLAKNGGCLCLTPGLWEITPGKPPQLQRIDEDPPQVISKSEEKYKEKMDTNVMPRSKRFEPAPSDRQIAVPAGTELVIVSLNRLTEWLGARTALDFHALFAPDLGSAHILQSAARRFARIVTQELPPFDLESFLREEAGVDPGSVAKYLPILREKVDETSLRLLTDAALENWGIVPGGHRLKILAAAQRRSANAAP
jgi:hypothetical protein